MKIVRKILTIIIITVMMTMILAGNGKKATGIGKSFSARQPVKVGLISKDLTDDYLVFIRQDLEDIQKKNKGKVEFTFYDSKSELAIQNENIDKALKEGINLILLDIVDTRATQEVINKIKQDNIPVIMFNREPLTMDPIKSYSRALYIGTDSKQAGTLQGEMLVDAWNNNKESIDKNRDNIMQYVMLQGERYNKVPIERTKYSVLTIQQAGIKTEELALRVCDWNTDVARNATEALILKYGDKIEVIIANDDTMAIGAIQALQTYGYNKGDKTKTIQVVGVDGVPEAIELISKGMMLGTAVQDPNDMAETLYTVGINLVYNKNPLEGTQYKFDDTGVAIRLPYTAYIEKSNK